MGYIRAEDVLPEELIRAIQEYADGVMLYIPKKDGSRKAWGSRSGSRERLTGRNGRIYEEYRAGSSISELAERYFLSEKSIQRIIRSTVPSGQLQQDGGNGK